ncbi:MAG: glycosyltransferase family 2 protein [Acidimicrobiia bacterium]|nr:glycosyltransferase family 2 protein [Acidimicrobiia bacterium]
MTTAAGSASSRPSLSALMLNYNHGRYLGRAIEAIVAQSRPADEFLILDDASTDDSVEVIERHAPGITASGCCGGSTTEGSSSPRGICWPPQESGIHHPSSCPERDEAAVALDREPGGGRVRQPHEGD